MVQKPSVPIMPTKKRSASINVKQMNAGIVIEKKIVLLISAILLLFLFGTIGFSLAKHVSLFQGFINTVETLTFMHDKETELSPKFIQIMLLLVGSFVVWYVLWVTFDLVLEGSIKEYFQGVNIMNRVQGLKSHWIICGGGRVGTHVAEMMIAKNEPYVIIDRDPNVAAAQTRKGFLVVDGDVIEEETLLACGIKDAKGFIAVIPETEKNVLAILTAKELNPNLKVYARVHGKEYVKKLKKAGADHVFMPEFSCAEEIVKKIGDDAKKEEKPDKKEEKTEKKEDKLEKKEDKAEKKDEKK